MIYRILLPFLLACVLFPSFLQAQGSYELGLRNAAFSDTTKVKYQFNEDLSFTFELFNANDRAMVVAPDSVVEIFFDYHFVQGNRTSNVASLGQPYILPPGRYGPGSTISDTSQKEYRIRLNSNILQGGGTVVVIWPRGALVVPPKDSTKLVFEIEPTSRKTTASYLDEWVIAPNPSTKLPALPKDFKFGQVRICNALGKTIHKGPWDEDLIANSTDFQAGIYILTIRESTGVLTHRRWIKID